MSLYLVLVLSEVNLNDHIKKIIVEIYVTNANSSILISVSIWTYLTYKFKGNWYLAYNLKTFVYDYISEQQAYLIMYQLV